jgi:hypothetical protein
MPEVAVRWQPRGVRFDADDKVFDVFDNFIKTWAISSRLLKWHQLLGKHLIQDYAFTL